MLDRLPWTRPSTVSRGSSRAVSKADSHDDQNMETGENQQDDTKRILAMQVVREESEPTQDGDQDGKSARSIKSVKSEGRSVSQNIDLSSPGTDNTVTTGKTHDVKYGYTESRPQTREGSSDTGRGSMVLEAKLELDPELKLNLEEGRESPDVKKSAASLQKESGQTDKAPGMCSAVVIPYSLLEVSPNLDRIHDLKPIIERV